MLFAAVSSGASVIGVGMLEWLCDAVCDVFESGVGFVLEGLPFFFFGIFVGVSRSRHQY